MKPHDGVLSPGEQRPPGLALLEGQRMCRLHLHAAGQAASRVTGAPHISGRIERPRIAAPETVSATTSVATATHSKEDS